MTPNAIEISLIRQYNTTCYFKHFKLTYLYRCIFHPIHLSFILRPLQFHRICSQQVLTIQNHHQELYFSLLLGMRRNDLVKQIPKSQNHRRRSVIFCKVAAHQPASSIIPSCLLRYIKKKMVPNRKTHHRFRLRIPPKSNKYYKPNLI